MCEKINHPGPIVIAKALAPLDGGLLPNGSYMWRMRIERSYRGSLRGTVDFFVSSGDLMSSARLTIGESYLLYVRTHLPDGADGLWAHVGCGVSLASHLASKEELAFLSRLGSRAADAQIFGEITSRGPADLSAIASGLVRVKATTGGKIYTALVRPDGTFDIGGLPPGTYRLSVQLPSGLRISDDDDPVVVQPHGCAESDLAPPD